MQRLQHSRRSALPSSAVPVIVVGWTKVSRRFWWYSHALAAWLQHRPYGGAARRRIRSDLEMVQLLPDDSDARARLSEHLEKAVLQLIENETQKRREPVGIVLAVVLLLLAGWFFWFAVSERGAALVLLAVAVVTLVVALAGLAEDAVPRRRDESNRPSD